MFCLGQVWKVMTTRSAKDISYVWTGMYFAGLALTLVYLVMVEAVVGAASGAAELLFVTFLIAGTTIHTLQFMHRYI
jgi:hypothetical protein